MKSKISLKWLLVPAIVAGITLSSVIIFLVMGDQASQNLIKSEIASIQSITFLKETNFEAPIRLRIPSINVNAPIQYVSITSNGSMDVPKGPGDVAWFRLGPRPGENGSAVMAGHYGGWKNGAQSVFNDLDKLKEGDKLYVEDEKGAIIIFVVRELRTYDHKADASEVFSSSDGKAHLNLITCEGVWISSQKTYSNRLVVFTDKEIK